MGGTLLLPFREGWGRLIFMFHNIFHVFLSIFVYDVQKYFVTLQVLIVRIPPREGDQAHRKPVNLYNFGRAT